MGYRYPNEQQKSIKIRFISLQIISLVRTMAIKATLLFFAVIFKLFLLYQAAYTVNNWLCISDCGKWKSQDKNICYTSYHSTEECKITGSALTYYTREGGVCNGLCGNFDGADYNWCFSTDTTSWDYCEDSFELRQKVIQPNGNIPPRLETKLEHINEIFGDKIDPQHVRKKLCPTRVEYFQKKKRQNNNSSNGNSNRNCNNNCATRNEIEQIADQLEADHVRFVTVYPHQQHPRNPVISITTTEVPPDYNSHPEPVVITVAISAEIHYSNLQPSGRDTISSDVEAHLANLDWYRGGGQLENDERGHLLADSLGGSGDRYNFVPQSPLINRNAFLSGNLIGEFCWFDVEENIRNFLINGSDGVYVRWTIVVGYGHLPISRRPTHFMLSVRRFNPNHQLIDTAQYIIPNIPSYACRDLKDPWWNIRI